MTPEELRRRLAAHQSVRVAGTPAARASVAMILRPRALDADLLLIQRATRAGDPWSGQMALPGGRRAADDHDVIHTAVRETREEVGIDVREHGELLGTLDELHAVARHRPLELVISPSVWLLHEPVEPVPQPREVASTIWVPLSFLRSPEAHAVYRRTLDGVEEKFPAYLYQGYTVWGLTHRILDGFLHLLQ
jgi:8-oxo-dGTP pyrophosphatase MutT (NUDIX family)